MSQGIYLILQGVVSIKYKGREIDGRGPNQHVGDECFLMVSSTYDYECANAVVCLFLPYTAIAEVVGERSKSFAQFLKVVRQNRGGLKQAVKNTCQSEANLFSPGLSIGKYTTKMLKIFSRQKKTKAKTKLMALSTMKVKAMRVQKTRARDGGFTSPRSPLLEGPLSPGLSPGFSMKMAALSPSPEEPPTAQSVVHSHGRWQVRHPDFLAKPREEVRSPKIPPEELKINLSELEGQGGMPDSLPDESLGDEEEFYQPKLDPNGDQVLEDSFLIGDPIASLAHADIELEPEASLEMAEVDHLHSGKTELSGHQDAAQTKFDDVESHIHRKATGSSFANHVKTKDRKISDVLS